ncbi:ATP-grasp domain-containing protein [Natronosporangium hydrolyticum]|uniref:ATP-grasp domain-containing protein n=1 Tax=Natronosporangium hydrolyticum TaxID=2811111 RepID=A0A895YJV2_9ACTN|nr:ATP-grasp domain-containing protein [Natronosporangium hydrolyticum]QSB16312.1 ATP-grasp domain-containing protein [Natronosporangium hydrolyticum]
MSGLSVNAAPAAGSGVTTPELVVLIRDISTVAVIRMAEVVRQAGCRVALVTGPDTPAVQARLAAGFDEVEVVADLGDLPAVTAALHRLAVGQRLSAVLATSDSCVSLAAQAAAAAGLTRTPAEPIVLTRNKFAARQRLRRCGASVPGYALLSGEGQVASVAAQVGLPAVAKPVTGTGSHLVFTVASEAELAAAYQTTVARLAARPLGQLYRQPLADDAGERVDPLRTVLVEAALQGREYCVDLVVRDGEVSQLGLVDKFLLDERFFELGFVSPPFDLPPEREQAIRECVDAAVTALGLDNTVAHVEVIDDPVLGPTIVEVNPGRPGGPGPMTLYSAAGVNTVAELIAVHRGTPGGELPEQVPVPLASMCFYAHGRGRLRAVEGLDQVANHPDVLSVNSSLEPGDLLTDEHEVIVATAVLAGFVDREDLVKTYHELAGSIRLVADRD